MANPYDQFLVGGTQSVVKEDTIPDPVQSEIEEKFTEVVEPDTDEKEEVSIEERRARAAGFKEMPELGYPKFPWSKDDPRKRVIPETGREYTAKLRPAPRYDPETKTLKYEYEEEYEPTYTMKELDKNSEWLKNARIIYKSEKGTNWKKSDTELGKWFKRRHSKLANDMVNMGLTALDTRNMLPKTKQAFVDSMNMFDDTNADWGSFRRAVGYTIADPTTWGSILGGAGVGFLVKKYGAKKAREFILKFNMKEQLKQQLVKEVGETAAETYAKKGFAKEITTETLSTAQKNAAKELAKNAARVGAPSAGAWSGAYDAEHQWLSRKLDRDGWEKYNPLQTATAVLAGMAIGGPATHKIANAAALLGSRRVLRNHQSRLDYLDYEATRKKLDSSDEVIPNRSSYNDIESTAARLQKDLNTNGIVNLNIKGTRARTPKLQKKAEVKGDAAENATFEDIQDTFRRYGIELDQGAKRGQFVGRKITEFGEGIIDPATGRKTTDVVWARFKRMAYSDSGLGRRFESARRRFDSNSLKAERAIKKRLGTLQTAMEKDYGTKVKNIGEDTVGLIDRSFRGYNVHLPKNVAREVSKMRKHVDYLQQRMWDSGVLKKEYDAEGKLKQDSLAFKIKKSMDGEEPELYMTRQYEVFDNPDWATKIGANLEVLNTARNFLRGRLRNNTEFQELDDRALKAKYTDEQGLEKFDYNKAGLTDEEASKHQAFIGKGGTLDKLMYELTHATDEESLFHMFSNQRPLGRSALKILEPREDIPSELRALMGEYKTPFANFQNSVMKMEQTIATYQYEKELADLIRAGLLDGAGTFNPDVGRVVNLQSRMPKRAGVARPLAEGLSAEDTGINRPLDGMHGTHEVADAILKGNEIFQTHNFFKPVQYYLSAQAQTRLTKTVYNSAAIARNFLTAGIMAVGAGYINPRNLKAIPKVFKGMYKFSDEALQAEMEKGSYLGYLQSGTILGAFRAAMGDAADPSYWNGSNPLYTKGNKVKAAAKRANVSVVKFYQLMDDVWKQFGFISERDIQKPILRDKAHLAKAKRDANRSTNTPEQLTPEENDLLKAMDAQGTGDYNPDLDIVHTFKSADGITVNITRVEKVAADNVAKYMQNYAGVPQYVRYFRLLPMADFLAFNTEIARNSKNILMSAGSDWLEGSRVMKRNIVLPDGTRVGEAQRAIGRRRMGSQIAAQSAAVAMSGASTLYLGLKYGGDVWDYIRGEDEVEANTDGIESFDQDYARGTTYAYLTKPENGTGVRMNLSFSNPYAVMQDPIRGTLRDMANGTFSEEGVTDAVTKAFLKPLGEIMGPSMLAESFINLYKNTDAYGRPIVDRRQKTIPQNVMAVIGELWKPYEPGIIRDTERVVRSVTDRPEDQEYALKPGTYPRKYTTFQSIAGLIGMRPEYYDIKNSMLGQMQEEKQVTGKASQIFNRMVHSQQTLTADDLAKAYAHSLDVQYKSARRMANIIQRARASGLSNKEIINFVTKDGMFSDKLDSKMFADMVNKGKFLPPKPNIGDMHIWAKYAKDEGLHQPDIKGAQRELMNIWKNSLGQSTGKDESSPSQPKNIYDKFLVQ